MKKHSIYIIAAILAVVALGCKTDVKHFLPAKDGAWLSNPIAVRSYVNSTLDSTWTRPDGGIYTFDKSGSANRLDTNNVSHVFTWSVNPDGDIVDMCTSSTTSLDCQQYLVISSSKDAQQWKATIVGTANGSWTEEDWNLTRVE